MRRQRTVEGLMPWIGLLIVYVFRPRKRNPVCDDTSGNDRSRGRAPLVILTVLAAMMVAVVTIGSVRLIDSARTAIPQPGPSLLVMIPESFATNGKALLWVQPSSRQLVPADVDSASSIGDGSNYVGSSITDRNGRNAVVESIEDYMSEVPDRVDGPWKLMFRFETECRDCDRGLPVVISGFNPYNDQGVRSIVAELQAVEASAADVESQGDEWLDCSSGQGALFPEPGDSSPMAAVGTLVIRPSCASDASKRTVVVEIPFRSPPVAVSADGQATGQLPRIAFLAASDRCFLSEGSSPECDEDRAARITTFSGAYVPGFTTEDAFLLNGALVDAIRPEPFDPGVLIWETTGSLAEPTFVLVDNLQRQDHRRNQTIWLTLVALAGNIGTGAIVTVVFEWMRSRSR